MAAEAPRAMPAGSSRATAAEAPSLVELVMDVNDRLTDAQIHHGFGGALALAYYVAEPRTTRDMDINLKTPVDEARSVFELLPSGVRWTQGDLTRCQRDGQIRLWFGRAPDGIPIDLFFPQHDFHAAVSAATAPRPFARRDYLIPVIAAAHLAVFKALFDRPKDWVDIVAMLDAGTVDVAETMRWLVALLGESDDITTRFTALAAGHRPVVVAGPPTSTGRRALTEPVSGDLPLVWPM